jgi:hypothetical protein
MKSLFLQGYGLSIKIKNTRLVFSQGIDPFSNTKEVLQLPASALSVRQDSDSRQGICIYRSS